jgi:endonuclease YncB( thermonuclease family)
LTWTHYVALSVIKDKKERQAYLRKAVGEEWSVPRLREILIRDEVKTIPSDDGAVRHLPAPPAKGEVLRLAFKRGMLNIFRVVESLALDKEGDAGTWLDCGFRVTKKIKTGSLGPFKPGDVVALSGTLDKVTGLKKVTAKDFRVESALYTYAARAVRIVDGDTLNVEVNLGQTLWVRKKLRLRRINAPEVDTPEGKKAKEFVHRQLKGCPWVVIKTYSTDIYDRYLVDIFYLPGCDDPAKIAAEGKLLNQELLDEGLAEFWRAPDPWDLAVLN